jgi:mannose-6-phosphate isomerase-like protein (cupin superfamily)
MKDIRFPKDPVALAPDWPEWLKNEFVSDTQNAHVGAKLVSQMDRARVWYILLAPGQRLPVHKHVLNYFWTVTSPGRGRSHYHNGSEVEMSYEIGQTVQKSYAAGEFMMHDLESIGETPLGFITVEFLDSPNPPLPL